MKNVIALAAGIADGLGYGDNTKAALITRGIAEITRLGLAMGADFATFSGLSGIERSGFHAAERTVSPAGGYFGDKTGNALLSEKPGAFAGRFECHRCDG